jgi:hypothetical protein
MRKFSKRTTAIVSGATAVGLVTLGTVAYAAFTSSANADAGNTSGAEKFKPIAVTSATWLGVRKDEHAVVVSKNLLPGDFGDVRIRLNNPANNTVNGKITSINPVAVPNNEIKGLSDDNWQDDCNAYLKFSKYTPAALVLPSDGKNYEFDLNNAVNLDKDAPIECQGMTFPTKFTVTFEATRDTETATSTVTALMP